MFNRFFASAIFCSFVLSLIHCGGGSNGAPVIQRPPDHQKVRVGSPAMFQVEVKADGQDTTYQWRKNGAVLQGATQNQYTFPSPQLSDDNAQFDVVVSNSVGQVVSTPACLNIVSGQSMLPTVAVEPLDATVRAGESARFSVVAGGNGPFYYQWLRNGMAIEGATQATLSLVSAQSGDTGATFQVVIYNTLGKAFSKSVRLNVN